MEARVSEVLEGILLSAPGAVALAKRSLIAANGLGIEPAKAAGLAEESARQRASAEAKEGLAAFREKRRASWYRAG